MKRELLRAIIQRFYDDRIAAPNEWLAVNAPEWAFVDWIATKIDDFVDFQMDSDANMAERGEG